MKSLKQEARAITDDLDRLLEIFPVDFRTQLEPFQKELPFLIELVADLGCYAELRFPDRFEVLKKERISQEFLDYVVSKLGDFGDDNRAGLERSLHRISCIRNRRGKIIGLTCRVGRAVIGTVSVVADIVESGQSILLLGPPGVGKTTMLREIARVAADELEKRVVIVDTSNEIAGDGDVPHPGIGRARRLQVAKTQFQHKVMIEAVENHMPEVVVIDEIGTEEEAYASRTIAERGVILVATAHGKTLENLVSNPTLSDLIGGIQTVTLSDEEARRRGTQKSILERKAHPSFDILIEIRDKNTFAIHQNLELVVDLILRGDMPTPEVRVRDKDEVFKVVQDSNLGLLTHRHEDLKSDLPNPVVAPYPPGHEPKENPRIFLFAVSRNRVLKALEVLGKSARIVRHWRDADLVLTLKNHYRKTSSRFEPMLRENMPVFTVKSNTMSQLQKFFRGYFEIPQEHEQEREDAIKEAAWAAKEVLSTRHPLELTPRVAKLRRIQHEIAESHSIFSESVGQEPARFVRFYYSRDQQ